MNDKKIIFDVPISEKYLIAKMAAECECSISKFIRGLIIEYSLMSNKEEIKNKIRDNNKTPKG